MPVSGALQFLIASAWCKTGNSCLSAHVFCLPGWLAVKFGGMRKDRNPKNLGDFLWILVSNGDFRLESTVDLMGCCHFLSLNS
jgi:hypothetical protein